jgi:cytochrome c556
MKILNTLAAFSALALVSSAALAHDPETPAEQAIHYRHGLYSAIGWNFGAMGAVVKGSTPYEKTSFAAHAAHVAALGEMLPEAFPEGSFIEHKTEAKRAIWEHRAEFDDLLKRFQEKATILADVSKSGSLDKIKPAFQDVRASCKACHEKFKKD